MEIRQLRSFCVAARLRSISKAAEQLGVGQPTVTTHVKKLEGELGILLFDRVKRPIQLTATGSALATLATPLVEGIDALSSVAAKAEREAPVSVASTYDIIPHVLLQAVKAFQSAYPHVPVRIRSGHRDDAVRMVREREVDMGVVPGPERAQDLDFQGLFRYERVLITPLGHPLLEKPLESLADLVRYPLILMERRTYTRSMLETEFQRRGLSYEVIMELDSMDMIKRYVALGMGISVGPRLAIEPEDLKELGVVDLSHLLPVDQAGVITLPGRTLSAPARSFIATLREALASGALRGGGLPRSRVDTPSDS
jgi:DNA-binding transcriptional LysR family regulator